MGNCAGSTKDSPKSNKRSKRLEVNSLANETTPSEKSTKGYSINVKVQHLSTQQQWEDVQEISSNLHVHLTEVDDTKIYTFKSASKEEVVFQEIKIPGCKVSRITENIIQWTNKEGTQWRLIFTSGDDVNEFLQACPISLTAGLREDLSTAALPDIEVETHHTNSSNDPPPVGQTDKTEECLGEMEAELEGNLSTSTSFNASIKSDDDFAAADDVELYTPSSPFHMNDEFILPDIMEETEEMELEEAGNELQDQSINPDIDKLNQTSSTLETETSFSEEVLGILERTGSLRMQSTNQQSSSPPVLPNSPPPGPLLVSDARTPLASIPIRTNTKSTRKTPPTFKAETSYRHSMAGAVEDIPPPLPTTQPPGKLMSPRHSLFMDLADVSGSYQPTQLDLSQIVPQMSHIREAPAEPKHASKREKTDQLKTDDINEKCDDEAKRNSASLVPPLPTEEESLQTAKRPESYYLKTFEPPKEFSDSGFQDTDNMTDPNHSRSSRAPAAGEQQPEALPSAKRPSLSATLAWVQQIDSSTTFTSDDQLTETSGGSVGIKPENSPDSDDIGATEADNKDLGKDAVTPTPNHQDYMTEKSVAVIPNIVSPIRKTGWLEVKALLVSKNKKVDMRAKKRWKKYWAYLKGSMIQLYECGEEDTLPELETAHVDMKLDLELSLAHAVHDHVKRDNLFCLSTSNGNTYYMQSTSQIEVEDWIGSIHCAAAVLLTQTDKEHSVAILQKKMEELKETIEKENRLKNMLSLVPSSTMTSVPDKKLGVEFSENLEKFQVELYRIRCYIASLQDQELPNPHSLLASISKPTKTLLGNIGIISVASLHAIVSARSNASSTAVSAQMSKSSKQKKSLTMPRSPSLPKFKKGSVEISGPFPQNSPMTTHLGSSWNPSAKAKSSSLPTSMKGSVSLRSFKISGPQLHITQPADARTPKGTPKKKRSLDMISGPYPKLSSEKMSMFSISDQEEKTDDELAGVASLSSSTWPSELNIVSIRISIGKAGGDDQIIQWTLRNDTTAMKLLSSLCEKYDIPSPEYFLRTRTLAEEQQQCHTLKPTDVIADQVFDELELCPKTLKSICLKMPENEGSFGLTLEPEWDKKTEIDLESVRVEGVASGSGAESSGIHVGDEIALVNGVSVTELGWAEVERTMAQSEEVELMLRLSLVDTSLPSNSTATIVDSLVCPPPPPPQPELSAEILRSLIIPTPSVGGESSLLDEPSRLSGLSQDQIDHLINHSNEIQRLLRRWRRQQSDDPSSGSAWTTEDKLRKSIQDLVETEGEFVRLLNVLVERYFEPLKHEVWLKAHEVENLTGSIIDIMKVQNVFYTSLKESLHTESQEEVSEALKKVLLKITSLFHEHMGHFKKYSSFCASYQIIQELLAGENEQILEFFRVRNPTTDPSLNVDRLLAKPIVRILRYPLFLKAMLDHVDKDSPESFLLKDTIHEMGIVADFINEMQRLCETYWLLINRLSSNKQLLEMGIAVKITELDYHGEVTWLNPTFSKGWKKGQGPAAHVFGRRKKESRTAIDSKLEAESTKYREILPTMKCRVSNLPDSDGVTNMWHLKCKIHSESQSITYLFRSRSTKEKELALEAAHNSIQDQQRLYSSTPRHTPSSSPVPSSFQMTKSPRSASPTPIQQHQLTAYTSHTSTQHELTSPRHFTFHVGGAGTPSASDTDPD